MQKAPAHTPTPRPLWGSPAGKSRVASALAALLPEHTTYVEPFAGSAAVLYAKARSPVEVLSDIDADLTSAFRAVGRLDGSEVARLQDAEWVGNKETFERQLKKAPEGDFERLHRFLYLTTFSFLKHRRYFSPSAEGKRARFPDRIPAAVDRLRGVNIDSGDYKSVVAKYDSPDTVFFFDPPYVGADMDVGERMFDEERFFKVLKSVEGRFLLTYGSGGNLAALCKEHGFRVQQHFVKRNRQTRSAATGRPTLATYLIANYELPPGPAPRTGEVFSKSVGILKTMPQERYLLGIVLEPDVVDAQGHIYSAEDIRRAAHGFMERHQVVGKMHRDNVTGAVKIIESYLMPSNAEIGAQSVRQGTWMLGVRVLDDQIWEQVRRGELTGFSVGGYATCTPLDHSISNEVG